MSEYEMLKLEIAEQEKNCTESGCIDTVACQSFIEGMDHAADLLRNLYS